MRFVKGATNAVPPDGSVEIVAASDGTMKHVDDDGTVTDLGGASMATASAAGLVPGIDPWMVDAIQGAQAVGCTEWTGFHGGVATQGSFTVSTPGAGGVVDGGALSWASGGAVQFPSIYVIQNPKTSIWYIKLRFKQSARGGGSVTANFGMGNASGHRIWLTDSAGDPVAGNWFAHIYGGGSVSSVDTGVASDTNWNDLVISHAGSGANLIYKLNGVQVASFTDANLTTSPVTGYMDGVGTITNKVRKYLIGYDGSAL